MRADTTSRTPAEPAPASTGLVPDAWMVGIDVFKTRAQAERNVRDPDLAPIPLYRPVAASELDVEAERLQTFEQWWATPTTSTAAPYTFMHEQSAHAAWLAARSAAQSTAPEGTVINYGTPVNNSAAPVSTEQAVDAHKCTTTGVDGQKNVEVSTKQAGDAWISVEDRLPEPGERVLVSRFAGSVINPGHPGHPGVPWVEVSSIQPGFAIFSCDLCSTGNVTHWKRAQAAPSPNNSPVGGED